MSTTNNDGPGGPRTEFSRAEGVFEAVGILVLGLLAVLLLAISWRAWPDPVIDNGPQWYAIWRVADGARLYQEFGWNYGPLSITANALLFRLFGPGMMVLVMANLIVHAAIVALAYLAFRKAWGRIAAFGAAAVFIAVFSFSRLLGVGGYDFVTPYTHESTHGILLLMVTALVVGRWVARPSHLLALMLGLCGGLAAVMKPEFMLAGCLLGILALILRYSHRQRISMTEFLLIFAGIVTPTLLFALFFATYESWGSALAHASHAWWVVLFGKALEGNRDQQVFSGLNQPWENLVLQARVTGVALLGIGSIWTAGWCLNRPWRPALRWVAALGFLGLVAVIRLEYGWFEIGRCFPALIAVVFVFLLIRARQRFLQDGRLDDRTIMALALVVLAGTMMARMVLFPRVYHFGFYQGALAGMVITAVLLSELPNSTGVGVWGKRVATGGFALLLVYGCFDIVKQSRANHAAHTVSIGYGRDRFYAFDDQTTAEINWALGRLRTIAPDAKVVVLQASLMVNYLSRHVSPVPDLEVDESSYISKLAQSPPDYVVLFPSSLPKFRNQTFGAEGQYGHQIYQWLRQRYDLHDQNQGKTVLLRRRTETK